MARNKKRSQRQPSPQPPRQDIKHDWKKDDEELELEEALFGRKQKKFKPDNNNDEESGMSEVEDNDLFTVDAPLAPGFQVDLEGDGYEYASGDGDSDTDSENSGDENEFRAFSPSPGRGRSMSRGSDFESESGSESEEETDRPSITVPDDIIDLPSSHDEELARSKRVPLWNDPSDEMAKVDISASRRLKKVDRGKRKTVEGELVGGKELQARLREQFERLHPPPDWAKRRTLPGTPSLSSLLTSNKSFISNPSLSSAQDPLARPPLPPGTIDLKRVRNANHTNPTVSKREAEGGKGGVVDMAWHPSKQVGVLAVGGGDRRVKFFQIDGHTNPTLLTLHIPSLSLSKLTYHPSGTSLLLTGSRPFYYTYDLSSQKCLRSPRNLFGSVASREGDAPNELSRHTFSPDGSLLAVAGRRGAVSILSHSTSGGGVGGMVADLRSGRGGTATALSFSSNGKYLSVLGGRDGAEVEVWDVAQREVVGKWRDDGMRGGGVMESSRDGGWVAVGSNTGLVNLYSPSLLPPSTPSPSSTLTTQATPLKTLSHLTTPITSLSSHPSSSILCISSSTRKDQLKLYHLPTGNAFSNWPTQGTPLGRVTTTGFSESGEWLGVGNAGGKVLLWSLRHWA
ncbi:hypothetical protein D1P53_006320 [Cryptococcus gattii VGV]|nr:hypothetical protein D1P53_006320 [Cryptococcus gattii VGV]